ncbi:phospholipase D-like domain-containing protein [Nesterenkonia sp. E16_10]|uniref:phospholipase D-like domain-containing protein n=1 Tax=unclassified Nesterenkonia TaxID=2629769 RepID=UPI0031F68AD1
MSFLMHKRHLVGARSPRKTLPIAVAASALAVPTLAALSVVALDLFKHGQRKDRNAPRPGTFNTEVEESPMRIYTDGESLYRDMLEAIESAEDVILMKTYIWKSDAVGQQFIDAFNAAARRGVKVFIIYDGFANLVVSHSFYAQLDADIRVFRMPAAGRSFWKAPIRSTGFNHSKILVIDDEVGFVGGYNIGSLYAKKWRDTHLREVGPAVWGAPPDDRSAVERGSTRRGSDPMDRPGQLGSLGPRGRQPAGGPGLPDPEHVPEGHRAGQ